MDFGNIKKKHIIIGTSALVLIAGGITAGVIANNSDEQATNTNIAEIQPTTEQVTTAVTTATTVATTKATTATTETTATTVKTTKKANKTEKKEDKSDNSKTEIKDDNNYEYDEPQYEEPAQQETPKQDTPAPAPDPEPAPEPEPEPEPAGVGVGNWVGYEAELYNYALSQGCEGWQAEDYVWAVKNIGQENVFIGNPNPDDPDSHWGIWAYDASTGTYWY